MMKNTDKGFTLFVAMVITGALLLVATSIVNLAFKQSLISNSGRESQAAFYAADTGMECALFWDVKNPGGDQSAFSTTTTTLISCNKNGNNPLNEWTVGGASESVVNLTFFPDPYCAEVTVTKNSNGTTIIESLGYNTCDSSNPRRVERAVRASY
jgi:Tfp pilus assembly protein PilX